MIVVEEFSKAYDRTLATDSLSFRVSAGQVLGLVGRNGAGKTTTLRCLNGIIPASNGKLEIAGFDVATDELEAKSRTAYVPDDPQLFHDLTVEQHLQFTASVYDVKNAAPEAARLLNLFELEPKRFTPASALSRGMRQKLAIACAYLSQPQALLLDEPMTGLDPQAIRFLKRSVIDKAKAGAAVIISSHLLAMVEDICSHVLILDAGKQKFFGTLEELGNVYSRHADQADASSLENAYFAAISANSTGPDGSCHFTHASL